MIELHGPRKIRGHWRREHLKVDAAGKRALLESALGPHESLAPDVKVTMSPNLSGLDVFEGECPCDEER